MLNIVPGKQYTHTPIMNGAGPVKFEAHVRELAESDADVVVLGSITVDERIGNPGRSYYADPKERFSLNSKGLPNPGLKYYKKHLPELAKITKGFGKELIVSIAGFSPEEFARLYSGVMEAGVDGVEINLGCPNVWEGNSQKRIPSFDEDLMGEILQRVKSEGGKDGWSSVKLSPYSDPSAFQRIADVLNKSDVVNAVVTANSFPNAYFPSENGGSAIDPGEGLAGYAGDAMLPIGLGQVRQLRPLLSAAIAVIGVGGISRPEDVKAYTDSGADAAQITTAYINFGPSIFSRVRSK